MALPIEDYALLGDGQTAALVGKDGSVDWLCLPHFDSAACFAALLGDERNGRWLLGPVDDAQVSRRYVGDSSVLETTYTTDTGTVVVTDFMPLNDGRCDLVRLVECKAGRVRMQHRWRVRLDYGQVRPWVHREQHHGAEVILATAGPDRLVLRASRLPHAQDGEHVDEFEISNGERLQFSTIWIPSHHNVPKPLDVHERLSETLEREQQWADACRYGDGPWGDVVVRSLVTLRLLTDTDTGGIVAAPTTSLPEDFGGERNWDYRFCWLRDASLTLQSLLAADRSEEAKLWRGWLLRAIAGDPEDMQIMYRIDGGRHLDERELDHLSGYAGSRPVRVGNGAVEQRQTDVLGEVMCALADARDEGLRETRDSWALQYALVENLAGNWQQPDNGLWEIRGPLRHFTHSRVMVWAAFDRAVQAVEKHGLEGPVDKWRDLRDKVKEEVLDKGWREDLNTFTQHYDTDEVDASLLVMPLVGFIAGDDPRMLGTIAAVERDLMRDGLLLRYRTDSGVDGLSGDENPFLACSFWLVSAYALAGRRDDAVELMDRLVGLCNDVGLLSEEYDMAHHRMVGNFPQAFSHLALVRAAEVLSRASLR
ncbi:MAG TPA: glycoside hydrolase family 15 protein [Marmoricola sp.]|nr:glycoside hydrolase family 15 protein [Marmoricola sp.]